MIVYSNVHSRGITRHDILVKQAFLRYIIKNVHLHVRSFKPGINLPPSTILTRRNNSCKCLIAFFLNRAYSKREEFAYRGKNSFPLRVDPL